MEAHVVTVMVEVVVLAPSKGSAERVGTKLVQEAMEAQQAQDPITIRMFEAKLVP